MEHENSTWHSVKVFCPNCRNLVMGYEDKDGMTHMTCTRCRTVMVSKVMGRRHQRIDVYAPEGEELIG